MRGAEGGTRAELKRRLGKLRKWLEELQTRLRRQGRLKGGREGFSGLWRIEYGLVDLGSGARAVFYRGTKYRDRSRILPLEWCGGS